MGVIRKMGVAKLTTCAFYFPQRRFKVGGMKDPTRIDDVLHALRRTWAGQPDLSLPTLMAMAATQGIGWGSSDEELMDYLTDIATQYPPELSPGDITAGEGFMLSLLDKTMRISLIDAHVIVRNGPGHPTVVWEYDTFRTTGPGFPVVITDTSGIDHRLGVTERITRLDTQEKRESLQGLSRADIGDIVYVIVTDDGRTIALSRRLEVASAQRRSLDVQTYQWTRVIQHAPLVIELAGGEHMDLGTPAKVLLAATS
ncbi:GTPase domain-containing protein [Corynebacterium ammoniagenes]|nr:GTPase domain-containing protein [Corynebacterium ammoniagenes]